MHAAICHAKYTVRCDHFDVYLSVSLTGHKPERATHGLAGERNSMIHAGISNRFVMLVDARTCTCMYVHEVSVIES